MKKLLSLLSVLTISGTAVPTTIAASPYQKQETINSDINYQKTNNLEKLNRIKREKNNLEQKSFEELINTDLKIEDLISLIDLDLDINLKFDSIEEKKFSNNKIDDDIIWINNIKVYTFNIRKNEPKYFSKLSSLNQEDNATSINWKHLYEEGTSIGDFLKNNELKDLIILNNKVDNYSQAIENIKYDLQDFNYGGGIKNMKTNFFIPYFNKVKAKIKIGFTYFWEDNNCYFQFLLLESKAKETLSPENFPNIATLLGSGFRLSENKSSNVSRIKDWLENFNIWRNEIKRQKEESLPSYSEIQKKDWKGDKFNELLDKIDSLKDKIEISNLANNFNQLKSDFNNLKNQLIKLKEQINNSNSSNCSNISTIIAGATSIIPVVGTYSSAIFTIISAGCAIANA